MLTESHLCQVTSLPLDERESGPREVERPSSGHTQLVSGGGQRVSLEPRRLSSGSRPLKL